MGSQIHKYERVEDSFNEEELDTLDADNFDDNIENASVSFKPTIKKVSIFISFSSMVVMYFGNTNYFPDSTYCYCY